MNYQLRAFDLMWNGI